MTPAEALEGATIIAAARAGDWMRETGSLEAGKSADFAVIDAEWCQQWLYHLRPNACVRPVGAGRRAWGGLAQSQLLPQLTFVLHHLARIFRFPHRRPRRSRQQLPPLLRRILSIPRAC